MVVAILRSQEGRERYGSFVILARSYISFTSRYDFFYKNGVPAWRGTGYYYARYRPGIGVRLVILYAWSIFDLINVQSVLVFLTTLTSCLQYVIQSLNYRKDVERIDKVVGDARRAAWGPNLTPVVGQRKVRTHFYLCTVQQP